MLLEEDWEKQAIIGFHLKNPLEGYRRLTFMMLDADIVAVSPTSVRDAPDGGQAQVDRCRCVQFLFEKDSVSQHNGSIECEARL